MLKRLKIETEFNNAVYSVFIIIAGLSLPLVLIFLIKFTGHSELIEETAKLLAVLFLVLKLSNYKTRIFAGIGFGFLFGLSESMLYLNNIFQIGDFSIFWRRFLYAVPMHIITVLMLVFVSLIAKKIYPTQKFLSAGCVVLALAGAVILHILFNKIV